MAANWRKLLNSHSIFEVFRKNKTVSQIGTDSKSLIAFRDGCIYIFDPVVCCVYTSNLKQLVGKHNFATAEFQTLLCSNPPSAPVHQICFNEGGTQLALWGRKTLSVMEIPQRWGKNAAFLGGKERIICQTVNIEERLLLTSSVTLLHVAWHPGSPNDLHLATLMSDNCFRVYHISEPDQPLKVYSLNTTNSSPHSPSYGSGLSRSLVDRALGEAAVAFDFGPPREPKNSASRSKVGRSDPDLLWPVYVLMGNGDVMYLKTSCNPSKGGRFNDLQGPLAMFPPAEDNYGTDSCSIVCLPVRPTVLVIATCEGKLHHSVVMRREEGAGGWKSSSTGASADEQLYVYETVELELSLNTAASEDDDLTCPVHLLKDPVCAHRYHCYHQAGVHTVVLPWQRKFQQYCDTVEDDRVLFFTQEDEGAIVEHLVCTRPLASSVACPVLGLSVVTERLLGLSLLVLTASLECITLPLTYQYKLTPPADTDGSDSKLAEEESVRGDKFEERIRRILQRNASNPILKTSHDTTFTPEESLKLIGRSLQVLREEYIVKQELAREEIENRIQLLANLKVQQLSDLKSLQQSRKTLSVRAHQLSDTYQDISAKQGDITARIEAVLRIVQDRLPTLSNAEVNMKTELEQIKGQVERLKKTIEQVKKKKDFHEKRVTGTPERRGESASHTMSRSQQQQLTSTLKEEGTDIAELVTKVKHLQTVLDM